MISNFNAVKTCQVNDIPTKVIKINKDIFSNFITDHFNYCIAYGEFPDKLKHADVIPVHKKNEECNKTNYRPWAFWPTFEKFMGNYCISSYLNTLTVYKPLISVDLETVSVRSTVGKVAGKVQGSNG